MPAATQFFEETFRPAKLLIEVYRLREPAEEAAIQ